MFSLPSEGLINLPTAADCITNKGTTNHKALTKIYVCRKRRGTKEKTLNFATTGLG